MKLSNDDIECIKVFFQNDLLSECFIQLYNYQLLTVEDIILEKRPSLIGFKRANEHLRLYVNKSKDGKFYIKIKVATQHLFMNAEMVNYQSDIDKTNKYFRENPEKISLKQPKPSATKKPKQPKVEIKEMKSGRKCVTISNISISDTDIILGEIKKLNNAATFTVRITENNK